MSSKKKEIGSVMENIMEEKNQLVSIQQNKKTLPPTHLHTNKYINLYRMKQIEKKEAIPNYQFLICSWSKNKKEKIERYRTKKESGPWGMHQKDAQKMTFI